MLLGSGYPGSMSVWESTSTLARAVEVWVLVRPAHCTAPDMAQTAHTRHTLTPPCTWPVMQPWADSPTHTLVRFMPFYDIEPSRNTLAHMHTNRHCHLPQYLIVTLGCLALLQPCQHSTQTHTAHLASLLLMRRSARMTAVVPGHHNTHSPMQLTPVSLASQIWQTPVNGLAAAMQLHCNTAKRKRNPN